MPSWIELLAIPVITGFVGWATNRLAIYFLFHPRNALGLGSIALQGLIPKRQDSIAEQLSEMIEQEFVSGHSVARAFEEGIDIEKHLNVFASSVVRNHLRARVSQIPLIGNFISDDSMASIEEAIKEALLIEAKPLLRQLAGDLESRIHVKDQVKRQILDYDVEDLEKMVKRIASKELRSIEWMGGVLGFMVGVLQLAILWFLGYIEIA